jgi:hypothetical protein
MAGTKAIKLSGKCANAMNAYALVDEDDYIWLTLMGRWHLSSTGYAVMRTIVREKKQTLRMHRLVNNTPDDRITDHINHDWLDNRKANLRTVTHSENGRNLKDQGKGYWKHSQNQNWVVEVNGRHVCCVASEDEAIDIVAFVRSGGTYAKPERMTCKHGHSLDDAYLIGGEKRCKPCQLLRSKEYYRRKVYANT